MKKYSPLFIWGFMIHFDERAYVSKVLVQPSTTLPETNIAHENPIFPGKYHQNGGFSMAMLVSGSVDVSSHSISILLANYPTT